MILGVITIIIVGAIAYFHYVQGAMTAAVSAFCALVALLVAFGHYEQLLGLVGQGKYADYAPAALMIMLFAATYLALRIAFDRFVPGNIRLQLYVEKISAGAFGLAAGLMCGGVIATAAQLMPIGPAAGGYARYTLQDRQVTVSAELTGIGRRAIDSQIENELVEVPPKPEAAAALLLPADRFAVALASLASHGAFPGRIDLTVARPDFLDDAFFNRLGVDQSGQRLLINTAAKPLAKIDSLHTLPGKIDFIDSESNQLRPSKTLLTYKPGSSDVLVVVRMSFDDLVADKDGFLRITPAAFRLVIAGEKFHPIGTIDSATRVLLNRFDDQIIVRMDGSFRGADFVFALPKAAADRLGAAAKDNRDTAMFAQFKLFGRVDLSGMKITPYPGVSDTKAVLRKRATPLASG